MDRIKTRFIIAVTNRLSAAAESAAKVDLIEELSENLYQRYLELLGNGASEEDAFAKAMEDLGDVEELLAYLKDVDKSAEEVRREEQEKASRDFADSLHDIILETVSQTKDAVDQAAIIVKEVKRKMKERFPNGFSSNVEFHFNDEYDDDHGEHPHGEDHEAEEAAAGRSWSLSMGFDQSRGFFCERDKTCPVEGTTLPSEGIKSLDVELTNGDVNIFLEDDPKADLTLDGDTDQLEVRLSEAGTLIVRQGKTATSNFFFGRGLASADAELHLPRRLFETVRIATVNGDVDLGDGLETGELHVKTTSGDFSGQDIHCRQLFFKSVSGDLDVEDLTGDVQAETLSGDITLSGEMNLLKASSTSGDIRVSGTVREAQAKSASGDVQLESEVLPVNAEVRSTSGDCELTIPGGTGFTLQYGTTSGEMESDFELTGTISAKTGSAIYLDGGESTLSLSSASGDIALLQL